MGYTLLSVQAADDDSPIDLHDTDNVMDFDDVLQKLKTAELPITIAFRGMNDSQPTSLKAKANWKLAQSVNTVARAANSLPAHAAERAASRDRVYGVQSSKGTQSSLRTVPLSP